MKEALLLTPGPTNVPRRVLDATALPMIHHRTKEFQGILERVNVNLQKLFNISLIIRKNLKRFAN